MKKLIVGGLATLALAGTLGTGTASAEPEQYLFVPRDIAPGRYLAQPAPGQNFGFFSVCGDYSCDSDNRGNSVLYNGIMRLGKDEAVIMVIPPEAVAIKLDHATLTWMNQ